MKKAAEEWIGKLYAAYHKRVYAFSYSYLKSEEDAMDMVHEVFLKIWEQREQIDINKPIDPFIFTITRNIVLSNFRKQTLQNRYTIHVLAKDKITENSTEEQVSFKLLNEELKELIIQLPSQCQKVFILSRKNGLSNKNIAHKLSISEKTVEKHITKALSFMRKHLKNAGYLTLFL